MPTAEFMCLDGEIVRYQDARIHAFTGVVKYGCGVFEGIRAYWSERERELFVFRLPEHLERMRFGSLGNPIGCEPMSSCQYASVVGRSISVPASAVPSTAPPAP